MVDINGQELREGDLAQLLCHVVSMDSAAGVLVRILNSEMTLQVGCKHDEVLGGAVADSELARFEESSSQHLAFSAQLPADPNNQADGFHEDGLRAWPME